MGAILFIQSTSPQQGIGNQEGLDPALMGSAFTECALLFLGEGVLQLLRHQVPGEANKMSLKDEDTFLNEQALKNYGIAEVFCCQMSLEERHLEACQLMLPVTLVTGDAIHALISRYDKTLCF